MNDGRLIDQNLISTFDLKHKISLKLFYNL